MDKRIIVAAALCFVVMIVWTKLFPVQQPPPPPAPVSAQSVPAAPASATGAAPVEISPPPAGAPITNRPEELVEIVTQDVRFVFSSLGGTLAHAQLLNEKFLDRPGDPSSGHDLVASGDPKEAALR